VARVARANLAAGRQTAMTSARARRTMARGALLPALDADKTCGARLLRHSSRNTVARLQDGVKIKDGRAASRRLPASQALARRKTAGTLPKARLLALDKTPGGNRLRKVAGALRQRHHVAGERPVARLEPTHSVARLPADLRAERVGARLQWPRLDLRQTGTCLLRLPQVASR